VQPGQACSRASVIGGAEGNVSAVHAPTSGTVRAIEPQPLPHPSGLPAPSVVIDPDGLDRWIESAALRLPRRKRRRQTRDYLRDCGVVGLGGAGFPSHVKLGPGEKGIETLILNGAECEPWITCDDRLMRERADMILAGAAMMRHIVVRRAPHPGRHRGQQAAGRRRHARRRARPRRLRNRSDRGSDPLSRPAARSS
jgi:electron transport complex protein RnfC